MDLFQFLNHHGVTSIDLTTLPSSSFYIVDADNNPMSISIPTDSVIGRTAFVNNCWDPEKVVFFKQHSEKYENVVLIDIGANVGLFSRQCLAAINNIDTVFAYEPHRENYKLLERNLRNTKVPVVFNNYALSDSDGEVTLYEDGRNCGNYSLNKNAMWDHPTFTTCKVKMINANNEQLKWCASNKPIFYKSDTQGFDEVICTTYNTDFWSKVECASFELWRIEKPELNRDKFTEMLNQFPNRSFQYSGKDSLTNDEIFDYMSGRDGHHEDLLCWK